MDAGAIQRESTKPMLSEDRDELLTVAVEFCKNATRSDAQAVIEAWSEDTKTNVARAIERAVNIAMGAKP